MPYTGFPRTRILLIPLSLTGFRCDDPVFEFQHDDPPVGESPGFLSWLPDAVGFLDLVSNGFFISFDPYTQPVRHRWMFYLI